MVRIGLVLALAASVGLGAPPAVAENAAVFTGTLTFNCFGCGPTSGTGWICVTTPTDSICVYTSFAANQPAGTCPLTGTASGTMTSSRFNLAFSWTRVGATLLITTSGDVNGTGTGALVVSGGNPCGQTNVTAEIAGALAGT